MTYQQIELIEGYITRAKFIKGSGLSGEQLYNESVSFEKEVKSSGTGYLGLYINWDDIEKWDGYNDENGPYHTFDYQKIQTNLEAVISELNGLLIAIPNYKLISDIREDEKRSHSISDSKKYDFILEMVAKYDGKISFGKVVWDYIKDDGIVISSNTDPIFNGVVEKLKIYMQELCEEKKPASVNRGKSNSTTININQQQQNTQTQTANQTVSVTFEDCFKSLDDCETLGKKESDKIKEQISELQELLEDSKGKKRIIREKVSSILKWIADKGTDVMIAVLPSILAGLQKM